MQEIGRKLYLLRVLHNYTQQYVSNKLDISNNWYGSFEQDASKMPLERLEKLTSLYGLNLTEFFLFQEHELMDVIKGNKGADQSTSLQKRHIAQLEAMNKILLQMVKETYIE